jgi:AraC family transcriptional regulator
MSEPTERRIGPTLQNRQLVSVKEPGMQLEATDLAHRPLQGAGLQKWRLLRVTEYVDRHLADPIRLPHLAAAAGLTRMHFAAQFRIVTGVRPHHYVKRRRIEKACDLLRDPERSIVDVALAVGFRTQAHFSTVFRQLTGESPTQWRLERVVN